MKKNFFIIATVALLSGLLLSCQKEQAESEEKGGGSSTGGTFTITATIADNGTKVRYDEDETTLALKPSWECTEDQKDIIIGFDSAGETYGFQVTSVTNGIATFSIITDSECEYAGSAKSCPADGTSMYMFYAPGKKPSNISTTKESGVCASASLAVDISSQEEGASGASVPALMMASGTVANNKLSLTFENKTAIIAIKEPSAGTDYSSITMYGNDIYTEVTFSFNNATLQASYSKPGSIIKSVTTGGSVPKVIFPVKIQIKLDLFIFGLTFILFIIKALTAIIYLYRIRTGTCIPCGLRQKAEISNPINILR